MIQMAENRGLFGDESNTSRRSKVSKGSKKKQEPASLANLKTRKKIRTVEVRQSINQLLSVNFKI